MRVLVVVGVLVIVGLAFAFTGRHTNCYTVLLRHPQPFDRLSDATDNPADVRCCTLAAGEYRLDMHLAHAFFVGTSQRQRRCHCCPHTAPHTPPAAYLARRVIACTQLKQQRTQITHKHKQPLLTPSRTCVRCSWHTCTHHLTHALGAE